MKETIQRNKRREQSKTALEDSTRRQHSKTALRHQLGFDIINANDAYIGVRDLIKLNLANLFYITNATANPLDEVYLKVKSIFSALSSLVLVSTGGCGNAITLRSFTVTW